MKTILPSVGFEGSHLKGRTQQMLAMMVTLECQLLALQWHVSTGATPTAEQSRKIAEDVVAIMSGAFPDVRFYVRTFSVDAEGDA